MRVAILGPVQSAKYFGGVATVVEELAAELTDLGHHVDVFALNAKNPLTCGWRYCHLCREVKIFFEIIFRIRGAQYDLVVTNIYYSFFLIFVKNNTRKLHVMHGWGFHAKSLRELLRKFVGDFSNRMGGWWADRVVANSYLTAAVNTSRLGLKCSVVPLGVRLPDVTLLDEHRENYILYVGRLDDGKDLPLLLHGFSRVANDLDLTLKIIGSGYLLSILQNMARNLAIADRVQFLGVKERHEIAGYYIKARCLCLVGVAEPFGLAISEALSFGTPVLCKRGSGFSAFMRPEYGYLVDDCPDSIAMAIRDIVGSEWQRGIIRKHVSSDLSWRRMAVRLLEIAGFKINQ